MIVLKFGGTSVGSTDRMRHVAKLISQAQAQEGPVCVVVSAMSGETNRLVSLYNEVSTDTRTLEYDLLVSSGEQAAVALLSMSLKNLGVKSQPLLGHQAGFLTTNSRGRAVIKEIQATRIHELASEGAIPVVAGFQGVDDDGFVTTLGRGGSDTSAVALAAALNAKRCDIYTDVSGVYTADPRVCKNARKIDALSFEEMMELASLGAKVLHPRAVEIAAKYNVPVRVVNTFDPSGGTMVGVTNEMLESPVVTAITTDHNIALFTLKSVDPQHDVLSRVFERLSQKNIIVDIIIHAFNGISNAALLEDKFNFTFSVAHEDVSQVEESLRELHLGPAEVRSPLTKVSLVGSGMRSHSGVAARVFQVLSRHKIAVFCITTSEIKISCVTSREDSEKALVHLHEEFFGQE